MEKENTSLIMETYLKDISKADLFVVKESTHQKVQVSQKLRPIFKIPNHTAAKVAKFNLKMETVMKGLY